MKKADRGPKKAPVGFDTLQGRKYRVTILSDVYVLKYAVYAIARLPFPT